MFLKSFLTKDTRLMKALFNSYTIWGDDPVKDDRTPYMTRLRVGPNRHIHIFWRTDPDDHHDHPWDFWTFPIWPKKGYYEEFLDLVPEGTRPVFYAGVSYKPSDTIKKIGLVNGRKWSFRPAEYAHRVLYPATINSPFSGHVIDVECNMIDGYKKAGAPDAHWPIITYCVRTDDRREWGFHKTRDGVSCWVPWKKYVFGTAKYEKC